MHTFTDSALSALDRLSSKPGPLNSLISRIAERIVPTVTAHACGGYLCKEGCTNNRCGHLMAYVKHYAVSVNACVHGNYNCQTVQCIC